MSVTGGTVLEALVVAGHDGAAELLVQVRYDNGVVGNTVLSADVGFELMQTAGVESLSELVGRSWLDVIKGVVNV